MRATVCLAPGQIIACLSAAVIYCASLQAETYFVAPSGNDLNSGLSPAQSWQTLQRVGLTTFAPGDSILLMGGQSFTGPLVLLNLQGLPGQPIVIGVFGAGKATIAAGSGKGLELINPAYVTVERLIITGDGRLFNDELGVFIYNNLPAGALLPGVALRQIEVSGFNRGGIKIFSQNWGAGFEQVLVDEVISCQNGDAGIEVVGNYPGPGAVGYCHRNVTIRGCTACHNRGQLGKTNQHTGSGILVGNTDTVLISHCVAYSNGEDNLSTAGGPVGIWLWDSRQGVIQRCESYQNHTGSQADGGGFDLDGGCVECVMQYNYSHDNDGAGFLIAHFASARPTLANTIRFNISENDGRSNGYAGIYLWRDAASVHPLNGLDIYHNTLYMSPAPAGGPAAFKSVGNNLQQVRVMNNLFVTAAGTPLLHLPPANAPLAFRSNGYFSDGGPFILIDNGASYASLSAWRAVTGQEMFGAQPTGLETDPQLILQGAGGTVGNPYQLPTLTAYRLPAYSAALDTGINLATVFSIYPGIQDFFSQPFAPGDLRDLCAYHFMGQALNPAGLLKDTRKNLDAQSQVTVFPNPSQGALFIKGKDLIKGAEWRLSDSSGRLAASGTFSLWANDTEALSVPKLPTGLYRLAFNGEQARYVFVILID